MKVWFARSNFEYTMQNVLLLWSYCENLDTNYPSIGLIYPTRIPAYEILVQYSLKTYI